MQQATSAELYNSLNVSFFAKQFWNHSPISVQEKTVTYFLPKMKHAFLESKNSFSLKDPTYLIFILLYVYFVVGKNSRAKTDFLKSQKR